MVQPQSDGSGNSFLWYILHLSNSFFPSLSSSPSGRNNLNHPLRSLTCSHVISCLNSTEKDRRPNVPTSFALHICYLSIVKKRKVTFFRSADNFFKKMTDLDSPRRNNDCYFYYYSTCTKGDSCTFRHEPSALGCETMCSFWKEGKCLNVHCNYRHMELRKNRKAIQCYWETQPGGCLKPHCPFLHQNARPMTNYDDNTTNNANTTETNESTEEVSQSLTQNEIGGQSSERNFRNQVDSLVVNFEEESDTESLPVNSPIKPKAKKVRVKTLEEIRLDRIQEESAAYFAYSLDHPDNTCEDLRRNLMRKRKNLDQETFQYLPKKTRLDYDNTPLEDLPVYPKINDDVFTKINKTTQQTSSPELQTEIETTKIGNNRGKVKSLSLLEIRNRAIRKPVQKTRKEIESIKIKTLEEIRAEKMKRKAEMESKVGSNEVVQEISSTTKETEEEENRTIKISQQKKKLKLRRLSSTDLQKLLSENQNKEAERISEKEKTEESSEISNEATLDSSKKEITDTQSDSGVSNLNRKDSTEKEEVTVDSTKYEEEMLLIDDLDYEDDGLMNEIDSILSK